MTKDRLSLVRSLTVQAMNSIEGMLRNPDGTLTDAERLEFANAWRAMQATAERLSNSLDDMRTAERLASRRLADKRVK
jgi:hypothetical protein